MKTLKLKKLASDADLLDLDFPSSGKRVSNTWVTCLYVGDNSWKRLLIPNKVLVLKGAFKASLKDGPAAY